jgi:signal transduction histidine kinase
VPDVSLSSDYIEYDSSARSELAVPLLDQGKVIGVIDVESDRLSAFDEADVEALQALAELVVVAIQNNQRVQELTEAKQLVSTRTTLAWMGLSNVVSRHDMARFKGILLAEIYLLKAELERVGVSDAAISRRLAGIKKSIERELKVDRPPAGHLDTELSSIPVNELIRKRKVAAKRGLKIEVNCSLDDSARVRANRHWLDQVLDILVNNAVDATTDLSERKVSIGSRGRGSWVEIYVSDNGPGIPEKIRDKLFRESIEKPSGAGGLGIGLLIAQAIVQVYGGDISWEDRHPNGTTMIISLPLERA